jgi:hypothetical protein
MITITYQIQVRHFGSSEYINPYTRLLESLAKASPSKCIEIRDGCAFSKIEYLEAEKSLLYKNMHLEHNRNSVKLDGITNPIEQYRNRYSVCKQTLSGR